MVTVLLVWLALVGMWPIHDPKHRMDTLASFVDVGIHTTAIFVIGASHPGWALLLLILFLLGMAAENIKEPTERG